MNLNNVYLSAILLAVTWLLSACGDKESSDPAQAGSGIITLESKVRQWTGRENEGLVHAAQTYDFELAQEMLKQNADVNAFIKGIPSSKEEKNALMVIVSQDSSTEELRNKTLSILNLFLSNKGNPNLPNNNGKSAVFFSTGENVSWEVLADLISHNGNPTLAIQSVLPNQAGMTPLMYMIAENQTEKLLSRKNEAAHTYENIWKKMQLLCAKGDINQQDQLGRTALMYAAEKGYKETVLALLKMGAKKRYRDKEGKLAKDYADKQGYAEIAGILE